MQGLVRQWRSVVSVPFRGAIGAGSVMVLAAALVGCRGSYLNPKTDLELRLDAARQMSLPEERDHAIAGVATSAADAGDMRVLQAGLQQIGDSKLRNDTAADATFRLVKANQRSAANTVARSITDRGQRDETLKRLAAEDLGSTDPAASGSRRSEN